MRKRNGSFCLLEQRISRQLDNEHGSAWKMLCLCVVGGPYVGQFTVIVFRT